MQVRSPAIDATLALQDQPRPFESPETGQPASSPLPDYSDHLSMLVKWFEESEDLTRRARELSERDRRYHDNFDDSQWTAAEKAKLAKRGQPVITSNYIKRKVSTLTGVERRSRSDPKAFPRTPQEEKNSDAATDALRFIGDQNKFNVTRSKVYEEMLIEGYGGADVVVEQKKDGTYKVCVKRVAWDRLFYDPHSKEEDFSDATYLGIVIWRDAKRTDQDVLGETLRSSGSDTYDDRPKTAWVDSKRTRVRVVQIHYLWEGQWMVATFTKAGFVEPPVVSPYMDDEGNSCCSLVLQATYVDAENNRFGAVRDWISNQDEINKRRSKSLHLLSQRQTYGNKRGVQDVALFKAEMAKPDGHAEINADAVWGKDVGIVDTGQMAQGQVEMLHLAINEMVVSGPNAAMAGKAPGQQSGRALEAQMQAGSVEIEPQADKLRQWTRRIYEAAWNRARQFWTGETWVRVTDDDENIRFVGLNRPVTLGERLAQMPEEMRGPQMQRLQLVPNDPRLQQVVDVENRIGELFVDIEIEEGPDLSTLQSEQFDTLAGLAKAGLPIPPDSIVEASSLRNKDTILKKMRGEEDQQNPALMQARQQLQQAGQQIQQLGQQLQQLQNDMRAKFAEVQIKGKQADIAAYKAETERAAALLPDMAADTLRPVVEQLVREMLQTQATGGTQ